MTADEVIACLQSRWPDSEYLSIREAPQAADRGGRKLDLLVVSLWRSRGLQMDGVEIKVSMSDWKRELANAEKADWWWRHVHRFWVAVPADLAVKVRDELPPTWGLLACESGKPVKVVAKAPQHEPEPMPWAATVGLMRAAADCGLTVMHRAESRGYNRGVEAGKQLSLQGRAAEELRELRDDVRLFEEATGFGIRRVWEVEEVAAAAAIVRAEMLTPGYLRRDVAKAARAAKEHAERALAEAERLEQAAKVLAEKLAPQKSEAA